MTRGGIYGKRDLHCAQKSLRRGLFYVGIRGNIRVIAQSGSASVLGTEGREFESRSPDFFLPKFNYGGVLWGFLRGAIESMTCVLFARFFCGREKATRGKRLCGVLTRIKKRALSPFFGDGLLRLFYWFHCFYKRCV